MWGNSNPWALDYDEDRIPPSERKYGGKGAKPTINPLAGAGMLLASKPKASPQILQGPIPKQIPLAAGGMLQLKRVIKEKPKKKPASRAEGDFRQNVGDSLVFEKKSITLAEAMQTENWLERANNEITLNRCANSTEAGRRTAFNHWKEFRILSGFGLSEDPRLDRVRAWEVTAFTGLLRVCWPQSAVVYAANWRSQIQELTQQVWGEDCEFQFRRAQPALQAAKEKPHRDLPLTPQVVLQLMKAAKPEELKWLLRITTVAFFSLLRFDEFKYLESYVVEPLREGWKLNRTISLENNDAETFRETELKKHTSGKGTISSSTLESHTEEEKKSSSSSSKKKPAPRLAESEKQCRRVTIAKSKTDQYRCGATMVFTCSCKWSKEIGTPRAFKFCPVHGASQEDIEIAKTANTEYVRKLLDEALLEIGVKNKPETTGERRLFNLHSARRGGAKCSIYSLGAAGVTSLGRWSHNSGTAMATYVEEALRDPVIGPIPSWPLLSKSLKLLPN